MKMQLKCPPSRALQINLFRMLGSVFGGLESSSDDGLVETFQDYTLLSGQTLHLKLVKEHSLWAHELWNAAKVASNKMCQGEVNVTGKRVLELGAGAALPSITAALQGASYVLCTDYPEDDILSNIRYNVAENKVDKIIEVRGLLWTEKDVLGQRFDHIFMADLIFNHREHVALAKMITHYLAEDGVCHVLYSHHVPTRCERDLRFFPICASMGLVVTDQPPVFTDRMFPEDDAQFAEFPLEWRQYVYYKTIKIGTSLSEQPKQP